ncbi:MAG TPA: hypothetical protein PLF81_15090 [Candidatus Anammoximicrobium sp.]|nr:hypothetical protein [Candidatus Anammoximicrobium sp.]
MKTRCVCWSVMLTLWTCGASAGEAPWEIRQPPPPMPEDVPAAVPAEFGPQVVSPACPGECNPCPVRPGWRPTGIKSCLQYSHWGYCDLFEEVPLGARLRAHQRAQICSGWAARLWLYRYDFCDEQATLNAAGHKRLTELASVFPAWSDHVLVVESTPANPQLDEARRAHVAKLLETAGTPATVVVGVPAISAPFGDETREWNKLFLRQIRSGGAPLGGSSGGGMSGAAAQPTAQ